MSEPVGDTPSLSIVKTAILADGGSAADAAGDVINYTIKVANTGDVTLTGLVVSDPFASNLVLVSGDENGNNQLDVGELWTYTASHTVTQSEIDAGGIIDNTATADSDETDIVSDSAPVQVQQTPSLSIDKTAVLADGGPAADAAGDVINYTIKVTNTGNMTLTGLVVSDPFASNLAYASGDENGNNQLDVGELWTYTANHTVTQTEINAGGSITNAASADSDQTEVVSDSASVAVTPAPPNVRPTLAASATSISVAENVVATGIKFTAIDPDSTLTAASFVLTGADAAKFRVQGAGTALDPFRLVFIVAPDFEQPGDAGANNKYDVSVAVTDGHLVSQPPIALIVSVTDVAGATTKDSDESKTLTGTGESDTITANGGADKVYALGGNDYVHGGEGDDIVDGGAGNDRLYGGHGNNRLLGGDGNDTIFGNTSDDVFDGGTGADRMFGGHGNDTYYVDNVRDRVIEKVDAGIDTVYATVSFQLGANVQNIFLEGTAAINATGNSLANTIAGNRAANVLTGGGGDDVFLFKTALGNGNIDDVADFSVGHDQIHLDSSFFVGVGSDGAFKSVAFHLGAAAQDAADRVIYDKTTGALYFDADGNGAGAQVQFAELDANLNLTHNDFFIV